jgi:hypothetical protein
VIDQIFVIDDVVPKAYQDAIEDRIFTTNFPWWYQLDSTYGCTDTEARRYPSLNHGLVHHGQIVNPEFDFFSPIAYFACEKINFKINSFRSVKSCLQLPLIIDSNDRSNNPHIDLKIDHLVALYYVNDSDGDTIIYNERVDDFEGIDKSRLEVKQRVSPKKGRIVLFDGKLLHNSSTPLNTHRCIINFDIV